jgi:hypothetical protein
LNEAICITVYIVWFWFWFKFFAYLGLRLIWRILWIF